MSPTGAQLAHDCCFGKLFSAPLLTGNGSFPGFYISIDLWASTWYKQTDWRSDLNTPSSSNLHFFFFAHLHVCAIWVHCINRRSSRDTVPEVFRLQTHLHPIHSCSIWLWCSQHYRSTQGKRTTRNEPDCNVGLSSYTSSKLFVRVIFLINSDVLWLRLFTNFLHIRQHRV